MDINVRTQLRRYVSQRLALKGGGVLVDDESLLFSTGLLDSLDAVEMVIHLEDQFGIRFSDLNFDLTLLDSVEALCSLVNKDRDVLNRV